jgi:hypothetical protein
MPFPVGGGREVGLPNAEAGFVKAFNEDIPYGS